MSLRSALFLSPRTRRASGIQIEHVEQSRDEELELEDDAGDVLDGLDAEVEAALGGRGS